MMDSFKIICVVSLFFLRCTYTTALTSEYRSAHGDDRKPRDAPIQNNFIRDGSPPSKGLHKTSNRHPNLKVHSQMGTGITAQAQDYVDSSVYSFPQPTTVSSYLLPEYNHKYAISGLNAGRNQNFLHVYSPMKGHKTGEYPSSNSYGPPSTYGAPQSYQYGPPQVVHSTQYGVPQSMYGYGGENSVEKGTSTSNVNFSAVGLLGLLAVMGMIQNIMTELDNVQPAAPVDEFGTGNSIGGGGNPGGSNMKPKPTMRPRPGSSTTTRGPPTTTRPRRRVYRYRNKRRTSESDEPSRYRLKRNVSFNENISSILQLPSERTQKLPQNIVGNFVKFILPSYFEVASILRGNGNEKVNSVTQDNLQKAKSRAEKIVQLLVNEFNVPHNIAVFCVNRSLEVMLVQTAKELNSSFRFFGTSSLDK